MSLPTWGEYTPSNNNNLPSWDDYSSNESKAENPTLPTWDSYSSRTGNPGLINISAIEQIESAGNNNATSSTGAKGLYQFMPDTSYEYSKRLFGTGTRDASTLSPEKQKEMASAYFKDLLKEFNGNIDEAIAAYNWGQGNVEKDVKEHGANWLDYAPQETQNYVEKYDRLSSPSRGYDHAEKGGDAHWMPSLDDMEETMSTNFKQIKDLWKGGVAEINKLTGNEYSEKDIDEAKDALNSGEGQSMKTSAAMAASLVAPELVPEVEAAGIAGKGASWLGKGLASSLAYQGVDSGKIDALRTAEDMATGAALEGSLRLVARPAIKQISQMYDALTEANRENPILATTTRKYLSYSRALDLGKHWKNLREVNPKATLLDAYNDMAQAVPELFKSPEAVEDLKAITKRYKNNGSHSEFIDDVKRAKNSYLEEAKTLAKEDADIRRIKMLAEANEEIGSVFIPNEVINRTMLQNIGEKAGKYFGYSEWTPLKKMQALKKLKPQSDSLIKDLQADTRRIRRERAKIAGKTGAAITSKRTALSAQERLNAKMIDYLRQGMKGNKVKINDVAQAIKDAQEGQFNSGKFNGLTRRFKNLSDKMEAFNLAHLSTDEGLIEQSSKNLIKRTVSTTAHLAGLHIPVVPVIATVAGKAAKAAKASNLAFASKLVKAVEDGSMTKEEAEKAISEWKNGEAKAMGKLGASLRESFK